MGRNPYPTILLCSLAMLLGTCGQTNLVGGQDADTPRTHTHRSVDESGAFRPAPSLLDLVAGDVAVVRAQVSASHGNTVELDVSRVLKPPQETLADRSITLVLGGPEELWAPRTLGAESIVFIRGTDRWQLLSPDLVWPIVDDSVFVRGLYLEELPIEPVPGTVPPTVGQRVTLASALDLFSQASECVADECACELRSTVPVDERGPLEKRLMAEAERCREATRIRN